LEWSDTFGDYLSFQALGSYAKTKNQKNRSKKNQSVFYRKNEKKAFTDFSFEIKREFFFPTQEKTSV